MSIGAFLGWPRSREVVKETGCLSLLVRPSSEAVSDIRLTVRSMKTLGVSSAASGFRCRASEPRVKFGCVSQYGTAEQLRNLPPTFGNCPYYCHDKRVPIKMDPSRSERNGRHSQTGHRRRERLILLFQLAATGAVLGWLPGNIIKLTAMVVVWAISFRRISGRELMIMAGVDVLFSLMDLGALHNGVFRFRHPDLLGLPIYEFFMWGFFTLHALRFVGRMPETPRLNLSLALAAVFAVPFSTVTQPIALFFVSIIVLVGSLAVLRDPVDLAYTGYLIAVGCVIEYIGVWTGQWGYPGSPPGGVALWFIPMWGGVGLFTGRLLAPLIGPQLSIKAYSGEARSSIPE